MRYDQGTLRGNTLVTVNVLYTLPDYRSLLNEYWWQCLDRSPYPRIEQFLNFWKHNIEADIKEVIIAESDRIVKGRFKTLNAMMYLK